VARRQRQAAPTLPFAERLVLNRYLMRRLGYASFEQVAIHLKNPALEELDSDGVSRFYRALVANRPAAVDQNLVIPEDLLLAYDENIVRHTRTINAHRNDPIRWKYFQYLALLCTEIYLDRFFENRAALWLDLQRAAGSFNAQNPNDQVGDYDEDELRKIAFWMATGAGKTLLMHINIQQYLHYLARYDRSRELNRIILLTPNEGLSNQHLDEFRASGIDADLFSKAGRSLYAGQTVEIIDIHKLKEESGDKTIAVDAFEGFNLVLADEAHRGTSGKEWLEMRRRLADQGFSFEYSATFGQAVSGDAQLEKEYARRILFDYSYRYFHADGYGKDFRILNLADDSDEPIRNRYLLASLLSFYQQLRLYLDKQGEYRPYQIDRPLWVFVGGKVTAVRTENKRQVSDVVDILIFLSTVTQLENRAWLLREIERLLTGHSGLLNQRGRELFPSKQFEYLVRLRWQPQTIYKDLLRTVFNSTGTGRIHVDLLKGGDGEISLRVGGHEPFGVINVGDASRLLKLCEEQPELVTGEQEFSNSLFRQLNQPDSRLHILIGSKKFTEGWSSWRVSSMGLMNIGRGEGPEIIQLFGRGVRLRGYNTSLKRSRAMEEIASPAELPILETLQIYGVRADYMSQFKEMLEKEGLPVEDELQEEILPVMWQPAQQPLKTLQIESGLDFKRQAARPTLDGSLEEADLSGYRITLNWYPRIQTTASGPESDRGTPDYQQAKLEAFHVALLDLDRLLFDLIDYKNQKSWFNLNITRAGIEALLKRQDWYTLYAPPQELFPNRLNQIPRWQEIAAALLKKFMDRFYRVRKEAWERPHLEVRFMDDADGNLAVVADGYRIQVHPQEDAMLISQLEVLARQIKQGKLQELAFDKFRAIPFSRHLYTPLIALESGATIKVLPVALNDGEARFVKDLRACWDQDRHLFAGRELYLLRNLSRGRGLGFFTQDSNFYPDFIMWLLEMDGDLVVHQHIAFIDPKGIRNSHGLDDPKINFHRDIKAIEQQLSDPAVTLNSFVIANTPRVEVQWWAPSYNLDNFARHHLLFQSDDPMYIQKLISLATERLQIA
jgi:hypothetical protein